MQADWLINTLSDFGHRGLSAALALAMVGLCILKLRYRSRYAKNEGVNARPFLARLKNTLADESGTATVEFALCFPVLLFFVLLTLQATLILAAHAVMQRSAAAAARAAVVQLPRDLVSAPRNIVGQEKLEAIFDAAWLSTMPISGRDNQVQGGNPYVTNDDANAQDIVEAVAEYTQAIHGNRPRWLDNFVEQRAYYAINHTQMRLVTPIEETDLNVGDLVEPRQAIAVLITHDLNLSVPFVRPIFATGTHTTADGPGAYTRVWAKAAKINQGAETRLPPPPPALLTDQSS